MIHLGVLPVIPVRFLAFGFDFLLRLRSRKGWWTATSVKELWFGTLVTSNENGTRKQQLHPQQEQQQQQQPTTTNNNQQQQQQQQQQKQEEEDKKNKQVTGIFLGETN